jgi:hypothetical protein
MKYMQMFGKKKENLMMIQLQHPFLPHSLQIAVHSGSANADYSSNFIG